MAQWILIAYTLLAAAAEVHQHGKERTTNFWHWLIGIVVLYVILVWGGFFNNLI